MRLFQIYFSPTGGTKKVVDILSESWDCENTEIDLSDPDVDFGGIEIAAEDICIAAGPVYGGRIPLMASENIRKLNGNGAKAIVAAVYGNRAYEDALLEMRDNMQKAGFSCAAGIAAVAEHSIAREFAAGRPDADDRRQLTFFAEKIKEKLAEEWNGKELYIPGSHPYKEYKVMPMMPQAGEACTKCGLCARKCPTGAILGDDFKVTDPALCISCMRCVAVCPEKARTLNPAMLAGLTEKLGKVASDRKENELFLV